MATATVPAYDLHGTLLEACSCGVLCPCWIGEDPDTGYCDAFNAYHVDRGSIRGVDVSGLSLVKVVHIPGNVLTPASWRQVLFVDDRASEEQQQALLDAFEGRLGGPLADLAGLVDETLEVRRARISHEIVDGNGRLQVGDILDAETRPYRGPTGARRRCETRCSRRSPAPRPTSRWPTATWSRSRSTGWSGPSRAATRSRPTGT